VKYDSILTVVCHVIKYMLFISMRETSTAVEFAELFFEHVECCFEMLRSVVSDRDSHITSEFWHEICEIQIIKRHISTAYHLQTNN
jgi:hypothetical protein